MKSLNVLMLSLALSLVGTSSALAGSTPIECAADGKSLSQNGGTLLNALAYLSFDLTRDEKGLRVLENLQGRVQTSPELVDEYGSYIGRFDIASVTENENYNPVRYEGYSQFKNIDATDTEGSAERGMWGTLVVEKNIRQRVFQAHYIFQSGDHMGGTLHLVCRIRR